ncbi:hypothetical protein [Sunxiuqinia elliptica]|uniref:Uncharacterized protein n=1 Tax=Sunxiuqinia elliptica TaxID=655355 RepID=A0A4R6GNC3_9BACT|nr:hypothetical protein [Sunxiuqinia elliptica]TDN96731.1 hypothetical protein DET52_111101 [Sunxiuqinia elliptica]TDO55710.1 hypothetical protein DET65_4248 [Sunxiuqinia elliptica]
MKTTNKKEQQVRLPELTEKLIKKDKQYASMSKRFQILYWIFLPVFLIIIIVEIINGIPLKDIIGNVFFLLAILNSALLFRFYYKAYNTVDYSQPTLLMLKKAVARYQPLQLRTLWTLLGIGFVDLGLVFNSSLGFDLIRVQMAFLALVVVSMGIGLVIWWVSYKPLRDAARAMIREIEGE